MEIIPNGQFLPPKLFAQILLVMRLTILFLTLGFLHVSAKSFSQEKITLNVKNMTLDEVFKEITRQSGYYFWSGSNMPELNDRVDITIQNATIRDVLDRCLNKLALTYSISDKMVFVKGIEREKKGEGESNLNGIDVRGKVVDDNGEPLPGATIIIKGDKFIITTNDKGEFLLKNVAPDAILVISNVGYETQSIDLKGRVAFNFVLKQKVGLLDETQVIAYGTTTQRYSVGSISKVSGQDIEEQPVTNLLGALEGRVPGLLVTQTSGIPGAAFNVQIRGRNSIGQPGVPPDNPLFIIDGVPFAPQNNNINQFNSLLSPIGNFTGGLSPFNSINPNDIESIEILRDADATSIYGSRGANGVVLITTKKGKIGKALLNVGINTGASQVTRSATMMNTNQYLEMRHQALNNDGVVPNPSFDPDLFVFDTTKYTDWKKEFIGGMAQATNINATLSGGDANTQFLVGGGYHHETFIFPGNFSDNKASFNTNLHHSEFNQRLTLDLSANYAYDENNSAGQPKALLAFTLAPDFPNLIDANGNLLWNYKGVDIGQSLSGNPLAYLKQTYYTHNYNLVGSFQAAYRVFTGFTLKTSLGYNTFNSNEYSGLPIAAQDPSNYPTSSASFGANYFSTWIIEPQAEYKKVIGKGKLDFLVGGTFQKNVNNSTDIKGTGYTNDKLLGSISAAASTSASDNYYLDKYDAAFGRINYIWSGKYIVNVSAREDGSSRFGPNRQIGAFGSISGGWIFSEEKFVKDNLAFLSFGKLRGSYGTTGDDNIGNYMYQPNWFPISSSQTYNGVRGYAPENLANPNYSWAVNKKLEGGIDFGLFKDRILGDFDLFRNRCGNQLVSYLLPAITGFTNVTENFPAVVQNTGWEVQLSSTNIKTRRFSWVSAFNLSVPKNKLLSFPNLAASSYSNRLVIGQSLSLIEGYRSIGVNDTTGVYEFVDKKGSPTYNPVSGIGNDFYRIGNSDPRYYGGFRNTFSYSGFQIDLFFQFTKQIGVNYLSSIYNESFPGPYGINAPTDFLNSWKKPGDRSSIQQLTESGGSNAYNALQYFVQSSAAYSDASYIRLKTASVSYAFPTSSIKNLRIQSFRLYVNAQNLFTISKYKGDPESQSYYGVPPLKTIVGGCQITF